MACRSGFGSCACYVPQQNFNGFYFEANFTFTGSGYAPSGAIQLREQDCINCKPIGETAARENLTAHGLLSDPQTDKAFFTDGAVELTKTIGVHQWLVVLLEQTREIHPPASPNTDLVSVNLIVPPDSNDPATWKKVNSTFLAQYEGFANTSRIFNFGAEGAAPSGISPFVLHNVRVNDAEKAVFLLRAHTGIPNRGTVESLVFNDSGPNSSPRIQIIASPNYVTSGQYPYVAKANYEILELRDGVVVARSQIEGTDAAFAKFLTGKVVRIQGWVFDGSADFQVDVLPVFPIKPRLSADSYRGWAG